MTILGAVLGLFLAPASAAPVDADSATLKAYTTINSAFIDLDKDLYPAPPAKVELGRLLFFDPRMSSNKAMSCATCHNPSLAWADGLPRARGLNQNELSRNTPSLFNSYRNIPHLYFWDGRANTLEEAAMTALKSRLEMSRDPKELIVELNRVPDYVKRFGAVYGVNGITAANAINAVGAFIDASAKPGATPFDRFATDRSALGERERRGMALFAGKARCLICHTGPFFSDDFFHNTGLKATPGLVDAGRYGVTHERRAWRAFRTPTLRNVALTGPYMHDGSIATLREVVDFYDRGTDDPDSRDPQIQPLGLTPGEKADLLAFLNSLTSPQKPVTLPILPPEQSPEDQAQWAALVRERLAWLDDAVKRGDRPALAADAAILREDAGLLRAMNAADRPHDLEPACIGDMERHAWELSAESDAASASKLKESAKDLKDAATACLSAAPPRPAKGAACSKDFSFAGLVKAMSRDNYSGDDLARINDAAIREVLFYIEYKTILEGGTGSCDEVKGFTKTYAGITIPAEKVCRERYYEDMVAHDLITRSPEFTKNCRESLIHSYDYLAMDPASADEACGILQRSIDDPDKACDQLVPRYLQGVKKESCRNILERLRPGQDKKICDNLDGAPTDWKLRCLSLNAFNQAYWKKDPALCGDFELCRAFMGQKDKSLDLTVVRGREAVCRTVGARD